MASTSERERGGEREIERERESLLTLLFQTGTLLALSILGPAELHCPKTTKCFRSGYSQPLIN